MQQRSFGATGMTVSALGFGCGNVGGLMVHGTADEQRDAVARALDAGITYFDTAQQYGQGRSEENLGRTLTELGAWERVVVGTKFRLSRDDRRNPRPVIYQSVQDSLRRLGRDHVDIIHLHNPLRAFEPPETSHDLPVLDVMEKVRIVMEDLVSDGLCRFTGLTGLGDAGAIKVCLSGAGVSSVQTYFNALNPSAGHRGITGGGQDFSGLIEQAGGEGAGVIAIRVLAAGAMSGSAARAPYAAPIGGGALAEGGEFSSDLGRAQALAALAQELGLENTMELSVRFVLATPAVSTALVGVSDLAQLEAAIRWAERGPLSDAMVQQVLAAAEAAAV